MALRGTVGFPVARVKGGRVFTVEDPVIQERPYTIFLNDQELVTLVCSPVFIQELAVGFLCSEGVLSRREDLRGITVNESDGLVWVETKEGAVPAAAQTFLRRFVTTCCGRGRAAFYFLNDARGMNRLESRLCLTPEQVFALSRRLEESSALFAATGGAHSAALCTSTEMILLFEDVGRHNAVDKIFGRCFLEGIDTADKVMVFSGRVSSEILIKVARMKIPVIIARGAPTDLALEMAEELGVTVVGFAREERFNVYTHRQRIKF